MGTVGGAESIVHIDFGKGGKLFCKFRIVLFFFSVEPDIFQQKNFSAL